jgi:hypothetical protein
MGNFSDAAVEQGKAPGIFLQQDYYFADERRIIGAPAFEKRALLGFGNVGGLVK